MDVRIALISPEDSVEFVMEGLRKTQVELLERVALKAEDLRADLAPVMLVTCAETFFRARKDWAGQEVLTQMRCGLEAGHKGEHHE